MLIEITLKNGKSVTDGKQFDTLPEALKYHGVTFADGYVMLEDLITTDENRKLTIESKPGQKVTVRTAGYEVTEITGAHALYYLERMIEKNLY